MKKIKKEEVSEKMKTDKAKNIKTRFFAILLSLVLLIGLVPGTGMKVFATDVHTETVTETSDVTNLENEGSDTVDVNGPVTVEEDGKRINDESTTGITERLATDSEASLEKSEERIEKPKAGSHDEENIGGVAKAAPIRQELSVGGVKISSTGYWITGDDGSVIVYSGEGTPTDNYIYYDKDTNTLTLHNITIKKANHNRFSSPILSQLSYATGIGVYNHEGDAELTIRLEGDNKIENLSIPVDMYTNQDSATASLTIEGDGSLHTEGYGNGGINVISIYGNTNLSINNAKVTANTKVGLSGVYMRSGKGEGINSSLTVSGGSLTASCANMLSAGHEFHGIGFNFGSSFKGLGTPTITISNNGVIAAGNDGIVSNASSVQFETGNDGSGGIVFDGKQGTVYGNVTLSEDLNFAEGESLIVPKGGNLTISEGARLTIPEGKTITVKYGGSLINNGQILNNGKIHNRGKITGNKIEGKQLPQVENGNLTDATVDKEYSAQLDKNNDSIKWSLKEDSQLPKGLTLDGDTGVISGKPTETGDFTFTLLAENDGGSEFKTFKITINPVNKEDGKPVNYVVTVQTEGKGEAGSNPMIATSGTKVILNAKPDAGYVFKGWEVVSGSAKIEDNSFIMPTENVVVKVVFEKEKTAPNKQPNTKVLDKQSNTKVLPKTGEESNIGLWMSLMTLSMLFFVIYAVSIRRKEEN